MEPGGVHLRKDVGVLVRVVCLLRKARLELRNRHRLVHEDLVDELEVKALALEVELAQIGVLRQLKPHEQGKLGLLRRLDQLGVEGRGAGRRDDGRRRLREVNERLARGRADLDVEPRLARLNEDVVVVVDDGDAVRDRVRQVRLPREAVAERRDGHGLVDAHLLAQLLEQHVAKANAALDGAVALGLLARAHEPGDGHRCAAARRIGRDLAHGQGLAHVGLRHLEEGALGAPRAAAAVAQAHARRRDALDAAAVALVGGLPQHGRYRRLRRLLGARVGQRRRLEDEVADVRVELDQLDAPVREVLRDGVKVGRARVLPRPHLDAHAAHGREVGDVLGPVARRDDERLRDRAIVIAHDAHDVFGLALAVSLRHVRVGGGKGLRADDKALADARADARARLEQLDEIARRHAQRRVVLVGDVARVHKDVDVVDDDVPHDRATARADRGRRLVKERLPRGLLLDAGADVLRGLDTGDARNHELLELVERLLRVGVEHELQAARDQALDAGAVAHHLAHRVRLDELRAHGHREDARLLAVDDRPVDVLRGRNAGDARDHEPLEPVERLLRVGLEHEHRALELVAGDALDARALADLVAHGDGLDELVAHGQPDDADLLAVDDLLEHARGEGLDAEDYGLVERIERLLRVRQEPQRVLASATDFRAVAHLVADRVDARVALAHQAPEVLRRGELDDAGDLALPRGDARRRAELGRDRERAGGAAHRRREELGRDRERAGGAAHRRRAELGRVRRE